VADFTRPMTLGRVGVRVHLVDVAPQARFTIAFGLPDTEGLLYQAVC